MRAILLLCLWLTTQAALADDGSLHQRIDALVAQGAKGGAVAKPTDDAEFFRRIWLDFAGRIPTAQGTKDFLANPASDKRQKAIEELFVAPAYADRMADAFNVILLERRGENPDFKTYLKASFAANKPWDQLSRELLNPDADNEGARAAGFFLSKRLENYGQNPIDYPGLTRDVGRLFLGMDLQCAECHNHLFIDDYKQADFQGLFAVYRNMFVRTDVKFPAVGERAMAGKWEFASVFDPAKVQTGPRSPGGKEFDVPPPKAGEAPKKNPPPPRPEFSGVDLLSKEITHRDNRQFAKNAANRIWFVLMGRGIVHPLDMHHSANPPSHPELLDLLATELVAHNFDIKWLLKEIALTATYQRSSQEPDPTKPADPARFLVAVERRLSSEQLMWSTLQAIGDIERATGATKNDGASPLPATDQIKKGFSDAFANDARDPEETVNSTVKGALFWRNDAAFTQVLRRRPGNLLDRLAAVQDNTQLVDELYLSILSRRPSSNEQVDFVAFLSKPGSDRDAAIRDAAWALISSMEFFVNH